MSRTIVLCSYIGAFVACATTRRNQQEDESTPSYGADVYVADDAVQGAPDAKKPVDAYSRCSEGGWCETALPTGSDGGVLALTGVWDYGGGDVWAISEDGLVLHWNDPEWSVTFNSATSLTGIWGTTAGTWIAGAAGKIFFHRAGAAATEWEDIPSGTTAKLLAICEITTDEPSSRDVWALSEDSFGNSILHWNGTKAADGSPVWAVSSMSSGQLYALSCSDTRAWLSGTNYFPYGMLILASEGDNWKSVQPPESLDEYAAIALWSHDSGLWISGAQTLFRLAGFDAGAPAWDAHRIFSNQTVGDPFMKIWGSNPNDVWAAGKHGRIYHWDGKELELSISSKNGVILSSILRGISGSVDDVWVVGDNVALHRKHSE